MLRLYTVVFVVVLQVFADVTVVEDEFGQYESQIVKRFTFSNDNNMSVQIISYGGRVTTLTLPDKSGNVDDVMLGYDNLEGYTSDKDPHFGSVLGRVANRIGGAKFILHGVQYNVTANEGQNQLHGGFIGFDRVLWDTYLHGNTLVLSYLSKDGEEGYPGSVLTQVTYELTSSNELIFTVKATSTKPTPINIANHAYINLAGQASGSNGLFAHEVSINADLYTLTNDLNIPTGQLMNVAGSDLDFRKTKQLGPLIQNRGGYDNNFCVNMDEPNGPVFVSRVEHPDSGRYLEIHSDQPGVQLYTGNGLPKPGSSDVLIGKGGVEYEQYGSFSLETQNWPDAVNHENFPNSILNPGEIYSKVTIYKFGVVGKRATSSLKCGAKHKISRLF